MYIVSNFQIGNACFKAEIDGRNFAGNVELEDRFDRKKKNRTSAVTDRVSASTVQYTTQTQ